MEDLFISYIWTFFGFSIFCALEEARWLRRWALRLWVLRLTLGAMVCEVEQREAPLLMPAGTTCDGTETVALEMMSAKDTREDADGSYPSCGKSLRLTMARSFIIVLAVAVPVIEAGYVGTLASRPRGTTYGDEKTYTAALGRLSLYSVLPSIESLRLDTDVAIARHGCRNRGMVATD